MSISQRAENITTDEAIHTSLSDSVSWGAILAGVVTALGVQIVLNMLGIGLGVGALDPGSGDNPAASTFSIMAAIWWTVSGILAAFAGGYLAGRLSGSTKPWTSAWHGFVAWALSLLFMAYLITTAMGSVLGGALSGASNLMGGVTSAVSQAVPAATQAADPFAAIERQVRDITGGTDPAALRDAAVSSVRAAVTGSPAEREQARERAATAIARAGNISIEDARARVAELERQYTQTLQTVQARATEVADATASAVSRGALLGVAALLLGALAGLLGGMAGTVKPRLATAVITPAAGTTTGPGVTAQRRA